MWEANEKSKFFSSMYDETWVVKLYNGFKRNLTIPMDFVCYVDQKYDFGDAPIRQQRIYSSQPTYKDCIQPYELNVPMILVGLDTIITGNVDHLAEYCLDDDINKRLIGLPRDPYHPNVACNGVALVPGSMKQVWTKRSDADDMTEVRRWPHQYLEIPFPGAVQSYKGHVEKHGLGDTRIVYFHGRKKPHQLRRLPWVRENWI